MNGSTSRAVRGVPAVISSSPFWKYELLKDENRSVSYEEYISLTRIPQSYICISICIYFPFEKGYLV